MKTLKKLLVLISLLSAAVCFGQKNKPAPAAESNKMSLQDSLAVKELYFSGLSSKTINNLSLALDFFQKVIAADVANDAAYYELASINHAQNREKEAETYLKIALTIKPKNEWYWLLMADIYKKTGNITNLIAVFDSLMGIAPNNEDYYFDKANALFLLEKPDQAMAVYTAIEKKFGPSDDLSGARQRLYQKQGKTGEASSELEKLIQANPNDVRNYLELSQVYTKAGNTDKALAVLQKARQIDPQNVFVSLSLADFYRTQKKPDEAFSELKNAFSSPEMNIDAKVRIMLSYFTSLKDPKLSAQADELGAILVKTNPGDPKAFAVYGDLLFQQQKLTEAKAAYKKALSLNNQVYLIWEQLIRIELNQQDFEGAVKDGEEALSLFPNQASLYLYTAIAFAQKKNFEKAVSYLKNAASLETEDKAVLAQIWSGLGDAYNALKRFPESEQAYDKSLQNEPDNAYTLNNYAYYLSLRSANLDKAEQMTRKSNEIEKNNASYEDTYAWVLFKQKKYKDARIWMEKSIKDAKENSATQAEHYGDILFNSGEKELAVEQWKLAKTRGSQSPALDRKINEKNYID